MAKAPVLSDLTTQYEVMSAINTNNQNIEDAFQNTLSLDGSTPNAMQADLDMDGNDILNVNNLQINSIEVDGINVGTVAAEVEAQRILAEAAATLAAVDSARAELAANTAEGILDNFNDRYLGIKSTAPTVDNDGNPLVAGALYYNNSDGSGMNIWTDPDWEAFNAGIDLALLKANNLSDLPNSDTALTNLGLTAVAINLIKATSAYGQRLVLGLKEGAIYDRASQAEAEAGTSDTVLMTSLRTSQAIAAQVSGGLGVGQTWQRLNASRAPNTIYQNTTGVPIQVTVTTSDNVTSYFEVSLDAVTWVRISTIRSANARASAYVIVPDNAYYMVTGTFEDWAELR